ncbi:haloalkane dehalogenase [Panicum miliaceum]|uniref:Haloalkane dehalogenase n=1 Tax=Panicum miliaceum TaxID=4540 RepID=A0A3L6PZQ7_PANMI|nr:haloalkane dehalogenase [Panicum miliaceum]
MPRCCPCATSSSPALFLLPSVPASSTSKTTSSSSRVAFSPCDGAFSCVSGRLRWGTRPRARHATVAASGKDGSGTAEEEKEEDEPGFNPFGGSRTRGGSTAQYVRSGDFRWFVRETGSSDARRGTIVFLHGAPTQSFSYHMVMAQMADAGYHCFAPDWIGFGFSEMPQPGYGFDFKEEEFHKAFDDLLGTLNITEPFFLVVQGFLVGSYGLTWALNNSSKVLKLAILNSPLTVSSPVPGLFQQLNYVLKLEKADVYRLPYLSSGAPGFALLEAARKVNFQDVLRRISAGFSSSSWEKPILLAWGISDKYLPQSIAEEFKKANPNAVKLPDKVVKALIVLLTRAFGQWSHLYSLYI